MAGYIIGFGFVLFAIVRLNSRMPKPSDTKFTGTIIEELSKVSGSTGRRDLGYAPRVSYIHPKTQLQETYEPSSYGSARFVPGETTELAYSSSKNKIIRPLDNPFKETSVLLLIGVGLIVAQYFSN